MDPEIDLSIVMPCLNEAETLASCIAKAQAGLSAANILGEIVVADNGSTDGSMEIARNAGVRVIQVSSKGYGSALRAGIESARGKWILIGDADDSYDFSDVGGFVEQLRAGNDFVMGCRLPAGGGTIIPGAMPWKNRWIGNPALSAMGRIFFRTGIHDFHCGMRALSKEAFTKMELRTSGMEFATEMVMKATLHKLRVSETPITLHRDGRSRPPHLKPWRDGWRHLRFMLIYSPRWLFLVPGLLLTIGGFSVESALFFSPIKLGGVVLDAGSMAVASMFFIVGTQLIAFGLFAKVFGVAEGLLPENPAFSKLFTLFSLEKGLLAGATVLLAGLGLLGWAIWNWRRFEFGEIPFSENLRHVIPATTFVITGLQMIFSSFFLSVLGLRTNTRKPPAEE